MGEPIRYRAKRTDSERFGMDMWVTGYYFTAPITDENSGAPAEAGWFFLAGPDQPTRHLIVDGGTAFTIDPATLEPVADDVLALLKQSDALRAEVLKAVLPSAEELARRYYALKTAKYEVRTWDQLPDAVRQACWIADTTWVLQAMGVTE